jgi:hypothetical protein
MPRRNRVTPYGELVTVPDRGLFWGNRGCLHDRDGNIVRYSRGITWAICVLEYKGIRRQLLSPGKLSELFFLDEATGLAAGHRPCGECRFYAYKAFRDAWSDVHDEEVRAPEIDRRMHSDRLSAPGLKRTYSERLDQLPDAAMVELEGHPWLVLGPNLLAWHSGGYGEVRKKRGPLEVIVLTPRATVEVLAAGYKPVLHESAKPY